MAIRLVARILEALRRSQNGAHALRGFGQDVVPRHVGPIGLEAPQRRDDADLQVVQELLPALGIARPVCQSQCVERLAEQDKGNSARRCLEAFVVFHRALPRSRSPRIVGTLAEYDPSSDPIAAFLAGLPGEPTAA